MQMNRRLKLLAEDILRPFPPLFRMASRLYHKTNKKFRTLSPGTPEAIRKAFQHLIERDGGITGDYHEFGLFRGYTFLQAWNHRKELGVQDMAMYGYDSFSGLPPAEGVDANDARFFEGQFACSMDEVKKNLEEHGVDLDQVNFIKGFYEDSLTEELRNQHPFRQASVVLLDCDYYSSTMTALNWLVPYLGAGSILLFDDWFSYGDNEELGQQKAFAEFFEKHPQFKPVDLWEFKNFGKAFILEDAE